MSKRTNERVLNALGERIAAYRRVRSLSREQLADTAGIGVSSLLRLESGQPGVSIGILASVLSALALEESLNQIATVPADLLQQPVQRPTKPTKR